MQAETVSDPNHYCSGLTSSSDAFADDSSGYHVYVTNSNVVTVLAPDGTQVYPSVKDTNGNYFSTDANGNAIDTLSRTPITATSTCNGNSSQTCYDVLNAKGTTSRFTVTTESISVSTSFGQAGVTEYSGTITVIQSIGLPDGTSYQFSYDSGTSAGHYGLLTSVTVPTGGQVNYTYTKFTDANSNVNEWVGTHSSGGGTWTFAQAVSSSPAGFTKGQQVTVTKPSNDAILYTFGVNNGAWPTTVQKYSGSVSTGTLLRTQTVGWGLSTSCPNGNPGSCDIQELNATVTVPLPGSTNISRTIQYAYAGLTSMNLTTVSAWKYYTGNLPGTPDRTITYTYQTGSAYASKNIITLPTSITAKDGAGNQLAQTNITYDSTALTSITGVTQHDDANFGTTNTVRGNPTAIQLWNGTSPTLTTTKAYDTTGQLRSDQDPAGNQTTYSYADNFFKDVGDGPSNPPQAYTPAGQTNSYVTTITAPLIPTSTLGYYYGTGQIAKSTDPNGATTTSHFFDPMARPTSTVLPNSGWTFTAYNASETQIDTYLGITGAFSTSACAGCRQDQTLFDSLGRVTTQKLMSDPEGITNVVRNYDTSGRVQSASHPYRSTSESTYGFDTPTYDGMDRVTNIAHANSTSAQSVYGSSVVSAGGVYPQFCAVSSCGWGYPTLNIDEAGKMRQSWTDGLGRVIEVDEPGTGGATVATGSVTISGAEQSTTITVDCRLINHVWHCTYQTIYDSGTVSITVNGHTDSAYYGQSDTPSTIAAALATAINADSSAPATASANGSVVNLTSKATGASSDYSLSASWTYDSADFTSPSFVGTPSSPTLSGGENSQWFATFYKYDPLNNLTSVTKGTQVRTYTYDSLNRVTSATVPEIGNMSSSHTTNLYYTTSGGSLCSGIASNACRATDPRGITTTYTYDALNRLTGESYSDGTTPAAVYYYDQTSYNGLTITNGKGRNTGMSDGSGATAGSFDAVGKMLVVRRTIAGVTKNISYVYNLDGSLGSLTYPSGRQVTYSTNNAQRTTQVVDSGNGYQYALLASYAAPGALQGVLYGKTGAFGGVARNDAYNNALESASTQATSSAGTALSLGYGYSLPGGNNGTIASITNNVDTGRSLTFQVDPVIRVTSAASQASTGVDCWGQSFGTDSVSNLTSISVTQCSAGSLNSGVNGYNQLTNTGFTYDAAGNMTADGAYTYSFDAENRMTSANGVSYIYDGSNLRVKKSNGTLYWRGLSGDVLAETDLNGNTAAEYVFFAGQRVARLNSSGSPYFYYTDAFGSTRTMTDAQGKLCYDAEFTPYGQEMSHTERLQTTACPQNYRFTGYEFDVESGLDYASARLYNPRLGRFMSTDPLAGSTNDPQSFNLYSYVGNRALSATDPSGMCAQVFDDGGCRSGAFGGGQSMSCMEDGIPTNCGEVLRLLGLGQASVCPDNNCMGVVYNASGIFRLTYIEPTTSNTLTDCGLDSTDPTRESCQEGHLGVATGYWTLQQVGVASNISGIDWTRYGSSGGALNPCIGGMPSTTNTAGIPRSGCTSDLVPPAPNPVALLVNPRLLKFATNPCIQGKVAQPANFLRAVAAGGFEKWIGGGIATVAASAGFAAAIEVGLASVECARTGEYVP